MSNYIHNSYWVLCVGLRGKVKVGRSAINLNSIVKVSRKIESFFLFSYA